MADFATVAELETFMGTSGLGSRGTAFLGYASAEIRRYTGQDLEETVGRQETRAAPDRAIINLTQLPVTAVSSITVDAVAFTEFDWTRWGKVHKTDWSDWDEGPIVITYDSGFDASSDEMTAVKLITLEVATRALGGPQDGAFASYTNEVAELRGSTPAVFLTAQEMSRLDDLQRVMVG